MADKLELIHHVGLVVTDLDRSIYFYHDILGLQFANEPTPWFEGPELARGVGVENASLRQVSLWVDERSTLELIEYKNPLSQKGGAVVNNHIGAAHVCFKVKDIHAKKAELEAAGVKFYTEPNVVDEGPLAGWRWCYFSDPDGLALELVQIAYYLKDERDGASAHYLKTRPALSTLKPLWS